MRTVFLSVLATSVLWLGAGFWLWQQYSSAIVTAIYNTLPDEVVAAKVPAAISTDEQITAVVAATNPAVVSVVITKDIPIFERYFERIRPFGTFGGSFVVPRVRQSGTEEQEVGGGSGFIITAAGRIVTNRHVVDDPEASYSVLTNDGVSYPVTVVAKDPVLDIAVLQITEPVPDLPYLVFADATKTQLGETVIAIGNALAEFRNSVSVGVVSGLSRTIVAGDRNGMRDELEGVIQTDAAINPGNSGGPLLNLEGEVIGVNVAASTEAENIGFALPADVVEEVVTTLVE